MRAMWFGTKQFSRWIKVHSPGSGYVMAGYSDRLDFMNGGVGLRGSLNGHMKYTPTWNRVREDESRAISDFASGLYGDGLFYLADPASMGSNALNKAWSAPGLTAKDGVPIAGKTRPAIVQNLDQSQLYPSDMAKYTLTATDTSRTFYIPIPPGYTAHVGVHGDTTSTLKMRVQPTVRGIASGASTLVNTLATSSSTRFSNTFAGGDQTGIELSIQTGTAGFITLAGLMVQVLPNGVTPSIGAFISGQGSSGLQFEGRVAPVPYSLAHDSWGLSVKLVEVEDHL